MGKGILAEAGVIMYGKIIITHLEMNKSILLDNPQEASEVLGITKTQVYRLIQSGKPTRDGWVIDEAPEEKK